MVGGDRRMLEKISAFDGRVIDGHCPGLTGQGLNAYVVASVLSDHECTTVEEAREKLRRGMTILIREASGAQLKASSTSGHSGERAPYLLLYR